MFFREKWSGLPALQYMDITADKVVAEVLGRLSQNGNSPVKSAGLWGSFAPMLAGLVAKELKRPVLYVAPHIDDADSVADDIRVFYNSEINVQTLVSAAGDEFADATDEMASARVRLGYGISSGRIFDGPLVITTSVQSLAEPVVSMETLSENSLLLSCGAVMELELVVSWLVDSGFERVDRIDSPGQYAARGGIVDIFGPVTSLGTEPIAIRTEFFADEIESIRRIDIDTQRSSENIDSVTVIRGHVGSKKSEVLFTDMMPEDTIVIASEITDLQETAELFLRRVDNPSDFFSWKEIYKSFERFKCLYLSRFAASEDYDLDLRIKSTQQFEHKSGPIWDQHRAGLEDLCDEVKSGKKVYLYCANNAEVNRVSEILKEGGKKIPKNLQLVVGFIECGFIIESLGIVVVTHHELFGQYALRRKQSAIGATRPIDAFSELAKNDYIVHVSYGIGKYKGIKTIERDGRRVEFLTLEYADEAIIHVPIENIHLVQKFLGTAPARPRLSKIGSKKWERQKKVVAGAVEEMAKDMLDMQAQRQSAKGISFGPDTRWLNEFEESFLYQETPDQITSIGQIKNDMQRSVPMDRLLCGDVGYGKTELAMRAAFKAVEAGKQVAVLVPTTVLCVQHGRTFVERFADFPIVIETINRFRTAKESADVIERTKAGKVDILIGTHRLLSKDIAFKDLGLLVIDEEQRFGVEHKEKLKRMRVNVDILTMTATPIPRTLHMSLLGLRDISSLSTPPLDRRAVVTLVKKYDKSTIRRAILHELNRDGQVFFLHNRVQTISKCVDDILALVPDARIVVAHGQMPKSQLESAMIKFVTGVADIMVCSTIIESGIDIPNANTIIINDADRFGLAQLHQLRGRVGRFKNKAYAYMLLPKSRTVTPIAVKRLKAIEEYSQLGAGFKIALRDLEIRGAGNILGSEQSGHINTVGYDMFCRMLGDAVRRLKNEPVAKSVMTIIELDLPRYIPRNYISSETQRLSVYRRIASAATVEDLESLSEELGDMYGSVCSEVQMFVDISEVRLMAGQNGIKSITKGPDGDYLVFIFEDVTDAKIADIFAKCAGIVRIIDAVTVYLRLDRKYFEPKSILAFLRKLLRKRR